MKRKNSGRRKRCFLLGAFVWICLLLSPFSAFALSEGGEWGTVPAEYGDFLDTLPCAVSDSLPDSVCAGDGEAVLEAAEEMASPAYLLSLIAEAFGTGLSELLPTLFLLLGS